MGTPSSPWRAGLALVIIVVIGWVAYGLEQPVPILDWFDLGIHEAGHLVAFPLPELAMFLAGSVLQVAVPIGFAIYFWVTQRDRAATAICLGWAGTSARDVAVYVADARIQALPLVGGGQHDWAFILGRFDALDRAEFIAGFIAAVGVVLIGVGVAVGLTGLRSRRPVSKHGLAVRDYRAPTRTVAAFDVGREGDPWFDARR